MGQALPLIFIAVSMTAIGRRGPQTSDFKLDYVYAKYDTPQVFEYTLTCDESLARRR